MKWADSAVPLALLRVAVPLVVLVSPELYEAPFLAAHPEWLRFSPEGMGALEWIPVTPLAVRLLTVVAVSSAATGILGFWSRTSMAVLTLSAGFLFSLSQRQGAVLHDMHVFWMGALLAASPCGEAMSLDAWGQPRPAPSPRYGVPLSFARGLLGLVYFFPGVHKLLVPHLGWISSANVIAHMHGKWLENGRIPALRPDHVPALVGAGAALVVAFEIAFVVLALVSWRTRLVALACGLLFHLATDLFLFIRFTSLAACYVVLLPFDRAKEPDDAKPSRASLVAGAILLLAVLVQGARGKTDAWPFACYPTFASVQGDTLPDLVVEADGVLLTGREHAVRSQAAWGHVFRISGAYGDPPDQDAIRMHVARVLEAEHLAPAHVRVYRSAVSTVPERWTEPPPRGILLAEW